MRGTRQDKLPSNKLLTWRTYRWTRVAAVGALAGLVVAVLGIATSTWLRRDPPPSLEVLGVHTSPGDRNYWVVELLIDNGSSRADWVESIKLEYELQFFGGGGPGYVEATIENMGEASRDGDEVMLFMEGSRTLGGGGLPATSAVAFDVEGKYREDDAGLRLSLTFKSLGASIEGGEALQLAFWVPRTLQVDMIEQDAMSLQIVESPESRLEIGLPVEGNCLRHYGQCVGPDKLTYQLPVTTLTVSLGSGDRLQATNYGYIGAESESGWETRLLGEAPSSEAVALPGVDIPPNADEVPACDGGALTKAGLSQDAVIDGWRVSAMDPESNSACLGGWGVMVWWPEDNGGNPVWSILQSTDDEYSVIETLNVFVERPDLATDEAVSLYLAQSLVRNGAQREAANAIIRALNSR